jgi:hypothetical protein
MKLGGRKGAGMRGRSGGGSEFVELVLELISHLSRQ